MIKFTLILSCLLVLALSQPSCRFAKEYTRTQLLFSKEAQQQYYESVMYWEGKFFQGVGFNNVSGITYDGHQLDYTTGEITGDPHLFTASSKESVHVTLLARILNKDPLAQLLISNDSQIAQDVAIDILTKKITSYEKFNSAYPGFGGYFPWVAVNDSGMEMLGGWTNTTPALDNGQLIWGLVGLIEVMESQNLDQNLTARYQAQLDRMTKYAATIFYDPSGNVRSVASIVNITAEPTADNYQGCGEGCYLNDACEGELFVVYLSLFGGLEQSQVDLIWANKVPQLVSVDYVTPAGNITVQQGWVFSAHEMWKFMLLPYQDVDIQRRLLRNGERARTWDALDNKIPGMFAAVNDVCLANQSIPDYDGDTGIQSIARINVTRRDVITGYSTMPLFLTEKNVALIWYDNYLKGPKGQTPYGAIEGIAINGTMISPLTTWDTKMTTVSAILDGLVDINRKVLQDRGVYEMFKTLVSKDWEQVFTELRGENIPFAYPGTTIPNKLDDFTSCASSSEEVIVI